MTPRQAVSLAAALSHAEEAQRIFAAHSAACPPELVFARYNAEQTHVRLIELIESLPDPDRIAVARVVERLRRAAAGHPIPPDVVPLIPRSTPTQPNNGGTAS